jgi:hypothetical protein
VTLKVLRDWASQHPGVQVIQETDLNDLFRGAELGAKRVHEMLGWLKRKMIISKSEDGWVIDVALL